MQRVAVNLIACWFVMAATHAAADAFEPQQRPQKLVDWLSSAKTVKAPTAVKRGVTTDRYRFLLRASENEVPSGGVVRLFCGVERISGYGDPVLNPFTRVAFPRNIVLAIYSEAGELVHLFPPDRGSSAAGDDFSEFVFESDEMRGKWIDIHVGPPKDDLDLPSIELPVGKYQFQLIACERFLMGNLSGPSPRGIQGQKAPARAEVEAGRSDVVAVTVLPAQSPESGSDFKPVDELRLLARLEVKECLSPYKSLPKPTQRYYFTVTNLSRSGRIAIIDPFGARDQQEFHHPIRWIYESKGDWILDSAKRSVNAPFIPRRSDFVILPPGGVASRGLGWIPTSPSEYKLSVDLLKGIVLDPEKIAKLETGDIREGWTLGGATPDVMHPDSILAHTSVVVYPSMKGK